MEGYGESGGGQDVGSRSRERGVTVPVGVGKAREEGGAWEMATRSDLGTMGAFSESAHDITLRRCYTADVTRCDSGD